jgi:type VI secretion system protein ImpA
MPLRGDLVSPIPGPNPAGVDLRYDPIYDRIKEARHQDDDAPQGDWQRARKTADYGLVSKLAGDALATRSKDLQLAAWLTEAQLRREGFGGLRAGLEFLRALLVRYWDDLYPQLEDGDPELRAAPLSWIGLTLPPAIRSVPLNHNGHDFFKFKESRIVGYEAEAASDPKKLLARQQALEEGRLTAEEFDKGFDATPKDWYKQVASDLDGCVEALGDLDRVGRERFGDTAPNFIRLQDTLAEVQRAIRQLLTKKLELDPDPLEPTPGVNPTVPGASPDSLVASTPAPDAGVARPVLGYEATDREDAAARAIGAARFLRRSEPRNPASYLILRGFRWGELRGQGPRPDPRLLEAPSGQVRTQLRALLLDANWAQLLETAETVMATPVGRGWLDLQRYVLSACEGLGGEFEPVSRAIRGELRALLADIPTLPTMTLMDDMPTANEETQQWLRQQGLNGAQPPEGEAEGQALAMGTNGHATADRALERAMAEVRAGRAQRGIQLLMDELTKEKTPRSRFLRRTQIARIMVDNGLEAIAVPILVELLALVENHKLSDWEAGGLVAEPMALLYRCIEKLPPEVVAGDHSKDTLYPRICSLDPLQAMALTSK